MESLIRHFYPRYYLTLEYIVSVDRTSWSFHLWNAFYMCFVSSLTIRFTLAGLAALFNWARYFEWDPYTTLFDPDHVFEWYAHLLTAVVTLYALYAHYLLYMKEDSELFAFYRYYLGSRKDFFRLNPDFKLSLFRPNQPLIANGINELKRLWHVGRTVRVAKFHLARPYNGLLMYQSAETRIRVVLLMFAIDLINAYFCVISILILLVLLAYFWFKLQSTLLLGKLFFMVNLCMSWYLIRSGLFNGIYSAYDLMLSVVVYWHHVRNLNRDLRGLTHYLEENAGYSTGSALLSEQLRHFYTNHWSALRLSHHYNSSMASTSFCSCFLTNIGMNVYLLTKLLFASRLHNAFYMQITATMVVTGQVGGFLICMLPLLVATRSFYSSDKYLYPLIVRRNPQVSTKLMCAFLYEQLRTRHKLTYTVGPLGKVTSKSLFQFMFVYAGYIMYMWELTKST